MIQASNQSMREVGMYIFIASQAGNTMLLFFFSVAFIRYGSTRFVTGCLYTSIAEKDVA